MIHRGLEDLAVARLLRSNFEAIQAEIDAVPRACFELWPQPEYAGSWRMMPLKFDDRPDGFVRTPESNREVVPVTWRLLAVAPGLMRAVVSLLGPQTHVAPHTGVMDPPPFRIHFALRVPDAAGLRVLEERLRPVPGEPIGFDPRLEHEAANMSTTEDRLILVVDVRLTGALAAKYLTGGSAKGNPWTSPS